MQAWPGTHNWGAGGDAELTTRPCPRLIIGQFGMSEQSMVTG